jgi:hypothetical protein
MSIRIPSFTLLLLLLQQMVPAQSKLTLTKSQLYADFDSLTAIITRVSPHLPVKKDLWRYDARKTMQRLRNNIDTITSDFSYYLLLQSVISSAQDMHTSTWGSQNGWSAPLNEQYRKVRNSFKCSVGHTYQQGHYYTTDPFVINGDTIPACTEIIQFEGQPIHRYVKQHIWARDGYSWNKEQKQLYALGFYKNQATLFKDSITFTFRLENGARKTYAFAVREFTRYLPSPKVIDTTRMEFWAPQGVLYIRLTSMDPRFKPVLVAGIDQYRRQTDKIKKVIIDLRDNPGGNDHVWQDLYSDLINAPIVYPLQIVGYKPGAEEDSTPLIKKYHLKKMANEWDTLLPSQRSLHFKGPIYVLAENHYSSAGSALSVATGNAQDQLVAIGRPTGHFLGIGFSPLVFRLQHTGLQFRVAPSMEVTKARKLEDLMFDRVDITIPFDATYVKEKLAAGTTATSPAFMLQYDPFIKAAMAQ